MFIGQVFQQTELQVSDTEEVSAHSLCRFPERKSFESVWLFTWKVVLKRLFVSETVEDYCAHSISGHPGGRALSQWIYTQKMVLQRLLVSGIRESPGRQRSLSWYDSFTWNMVLKRPFISDTGQSSGRQSSSGQCDRTTWKMVLKRPFVIDTEEDSVLHLHC